MPNYIFRCDTCNLEKEIYINAEVVSSKKNWNDKKCEHCNTAMYVTFKREFLPAIKWKGEAPAGVQVKMKHQAMKAEAIYNEGFTSESEVQESKEIAKEEEKKRGLVPGSLTTGVEMPKNDMEKERLKKRSVSKIRESRSRRNKIL